MRILVVSQYFWPENFRINDLVEELVKRKHEVTVLTGVPNYPGGCTFPEYKAEPGRFKHYCGAQISRIPVKNRGKSKVSLILNYMSFVISACVFGVWRLRGKDYDVIFVYEPSPVTVGIPAILFKKIKKTPVFFWVLDLWPETLAAIGVVKSQWMLHMLGKLVSFIYANCDILLAQSRSFIASIAKYSEDAEKIKYFPSWAEDMFCKTVVQADSQSPFDDDGRFTILFAGNIGEAQDFPAILDAVDRMKQNNNIRWLVVGRGRMSEWLDAEIQNRNLSECIYTLGSFPLERMPEFYAAADALLVTLKSSEIFNKTIPGKVQTYLASGRPVLGMLSGEGKTIINSSGAGYACEAGDSKTLAENVNRLFLLDKAEREAMGRNGKDYYQEEFSKEKIIDYLELLFEQQRAVTR